MTEVRELQDRIAAKRDARGFTTDPRELLCLLMEEVGEVASEVKKTWSPNYEDLDVEDLRDELADVYTVLSALATRFQVDLEQAVEQKFFGADDAREWATAKPQVKRQANTSGQNRS